MFQKTKGGRKIGGFRSEAKKERSGGARQPRVKNFAFTEVDPLSFPRRHLNFSAFPRASGLTTSSRKMIPRHALWVAILTKRSPSTSPTWIPKRFKPTILRFFLLQRCLGYIRSENSKLGHITITTTVAVLPPTGCGLFFCSTSLV